MPGWFLRNDNCSLVVRRINHLSVAVLALEDELKIGDTIHILGHTTDFTQEVTSLEIEHQKVMRVKPGDDFAMRVIEPVREHDVVYKIVEEAL